MPQNNTEFLSAMLTASDQQGKQAVNKTKKD